MKQKFYLSDGRMVSEKTSDPNTDLFADPRAKALIERFNLQPGQLLDDYLILRSEIENGNSRILNLEGASIEVLTLYARSLASTAAINYELSARDQISLSTGMKFEDTTHSRQINRAGHSPESFLNEAIFYERLAKKLSDHAAAHIVSQATSIETQLAYSG